MAAVLHDKQIINFSITLPILDSLVTLLASEYYPCGAKQCCHLTDTG